jgi:hypothetical protein
MTTKKDDYYFPHDMGARNDGKIITLRMEHGWAGYGLFWALVETLRAEKTNIYPTKDLPCLAYALHVELPMLEDIIRGYNLFDFTVIDDNEYFFSKRLCHSMDIFNAMKQKRIEAGRKGGQSKALAMLEQTSSDSLATGSKVKESKGKGKVKESKEYVSDSDELRLATLLYSLMKTNNEKTKEPNYQQWSKDIDLLHRVDGHSFDDIEKVLRWAQQDSFEQMNVLSPSKLRKRFAGLWGKAKTAPTNGATADQIDDIFAEMKRKAEKT